MSIIRRFLMILFFISFSSVAQVQDTLQYAREKAHSKDFSEANRILTIYNANNSDVYGLWLQAQIANWMGDFKRSKDLYNRAMIMSPNLLDLELDYGRGLFKSGDLKSSEEILGAYLQKDLNNPEAILMLAYIDYWNGLTVKAKDSAQQVLAENPENEMALEILDEINIATAPYISISTAFGSDDQPLNVNDYTLTAGKYHSRFLSPFIKFGYRDFTLRDNNLQSLFLEAGNTMSFGLAGPVINLTAGIFKPDNNTDLKEFTWRAGISQKLLKNLALEVNTARIPYQFTLASLDDPLMQQLNSIGLSLNHPQSILGKVAYERQTFPDDNSIHTAYAYLLKSLINSKTFRFDLGYSFSYAHSDQNTFRPAEENIFRPGLNIMNEVNGIYDPYFSPQNQMVNAALGSIKILPTEVFEIKLRTSCGVYAKADNPVLQTPEAPGNTATGNTSFYEQTYTPVEMFAEITAKISRQLYIKAEYQYSKLFFYELHRFGFSANYSFLKN